MTRPPRRAHAPATVETVVAKLESLERLMAGIAEHARRIDARVAVSADEMPPPALPMPAWAPSPVRNWGDLYARVEAMYAWADETSTMLRKVDAVLTIIKADPGKRDAFSMHIDQMRATDGA